MMSAPDATVADFLRPWWRMFSMRQVPAGVAFVCLLAWYTLVPTHVFAQGATQASITGLVRDVSGAVMPGVTVEVSSDALIEKVRVAVSDSAGRYRVVSLPPG